MDCTKETKHADALFFRSKCCGWKMHQITTAHCNDYLGQKKSSSKSTYIGPKVRQIWPPSPLWTIFLNKGYGLVWTFHESPLPLCSPHGLRKPPNGSRFHKKHEALVCKKENSKFRQKDICSLDVLSLLRCCYLGHKKTLSCVNFMYFVMGSESWANTWIWSLFI